MARKDANAPLAPKWFYWSDPLLAMFALGGLIAWVWFAAGLLR